MRGKEREEVAKGKEYITCTAEGCNFHKCCSTISTCIVTSVVM